MNIIFFVKLIEWFLGLFKPQPAIHIQVPTTIQGSPDWIQADVSNESQDWLKYLSLPYRTQWAGNFDEENCATRSAIVCLEAILNYYLDKNLFPEVLAKFLRTYYCNKEGYVKLSIRFNSKMNNTTSLGANVTDVWNNFNRDGLVPENVYPDPEGSFNWGQYYADVPDGIEQYGEMTTALFKILWTTIWNNNWNAPNIAIVKKVLVNCPVYFASSVGAKDENGVEQDPKKKIYTHARVVYAENGYQKVIDSYQHPSFLKKLDKTFPLACAIKCSIKII